ncbi:hypothetical protein PFBG_00431 [Plasmodium falciparum 7G8]|uniref:Uncharacterized protein n=1 Tax=Plasmodium falciparum (isolate 7G8) TaxID=57266 RepID=W7FUA8_PLAF8|nr:hypothetical protein PFBG_00431 [Plasmodium falciparum 7G8]
MNNYYSYTFNVKKEKGKNNKLIKNLLFFNMSYYKITNYMKALSHFHNSFYLHNIMNIKQYDINM